MRQWCGIVLLALFFSACGSQPESDIVGIADKDFQYQFSLHPLFNADTTLKSFAATLYLHSNLPGSTQFTLRLDGTRPGLMYSAALYDRDTNSLNLLASAPRLSFPVIQALDTTELWAGDLVQLDFDSLVNSYQGYLVVTHEPLSDSLKDADLLIKGRIGHN